jgi:hypothetical protein
MEAQGKKEHAMASVIMRFISDPVMIDVLFELFRALMDHC